MGASPGLHDGPEAGIVMERLEIRVGFERRRSPPQSAAGSILKGFQRWLNLAEP